MKKQKKSFTVQITFECSSVDLKSVGQLDDIFYPIGKGLKTYYIRLFQVSLD